MTTSIAATAFLRRLGTKLPTFKPAISTLGQEQQYLSFLAAGKLAGRNEFETSCGIYQKSACWNLNAYKQQSTTAYQSTTEEAREGSETLDRGTLAIVEDHQPVTDPYKFQKAATELLEKLEKSVEPMKKENDQLEVNLSQNHDVLSIDLGSEQKLTVYIDEKDKSIAMVSPYSGAFNYYLSKDTGEWLGISKLHSLEGAFVRDLNRFCNGVPQL